MKKIKIFLASSIVEFARERDELELFIRNVSDKFEDNYDTKIIPLRCENVDTCMTLDGKQEEFNQLIRESEMCFFIFFTRVGTVTHPAKPQAANIRLFQDDTRRRYCGRFGAGIYGHNRPYLQALLQQFQQYRHDKAAYFT